MKNRQIPRRLSAFLVDQDGAIGIVIALLLPVLIGFAGLAVDIGHMYAVNSQLKNAADAGALSGARALVPYIGAPLTPNWIAGQNKASQTVLLNRSDNKQLTVCQVDYGYWGFTTAPPSLQSAGIVPTANDFPAVRVKVSKTAGQNDGQVKMYLASVLGVLPADVSATSVAMITFPQGVGPGALKPLVATKNIVDKYMFDPQIPGQTLQFKIGEEDKHDHSVNDSMWSTFKVDNNSDAYTKGLIDNGNPGLLKVGDPIYLQPGVRAVDYGANEMGKFVNTTVVLPIVEVIDLTAKTMAPILGFIAFHITGYSQGGQYIEGFFDKNYVILDPQGGVVPPGPTLSTSNAPQLVN